MAFPHPVPARFAVRALLLLLMLTLAGMPPLSAPIRASDVVRLHVSPTMYEKNDLVVQVLIQRDADNGAMRVTAESSTYFASSEMELEGGFAPRVKVIRFRDLPSGFYEVTGIVFDGKAKVKGQARVSVLVYPK